MQIKDLVRYFTDGARVIPSHCRITGMEIETMFVERATRCPITLRQSQGVLNHLADDLMWEIEEKKSDMITKVRSMCGDTISYELGRHNLEVAIAPVDRSVLVERAQQVLKTLYRIAQGFSACPLFEPTLLWPEDLLVVPDERDATFVELDGREALNLLARTACVQFMFTVTPNEAITAINNLNKCLPWFLKDYPQAAWWEEYIRTAKAAYRPDRFGGPRQFKDFEDYCEKLSQHDVITPRGLVPFGEVQGVNIPLYLRSIWWYFRLRRFNDNLCIEVRPLPRRDDTEFPYQLHRAVNAIEGRIVNGF